MTLDLQPLRADAAELISMYSGRGLTIATAESCTGGLVSAALTDIPGASAAFDRGFITYSDEAKTQLLDVPADLIRKVGAVSEEVAIAMAKGALAHSSADLSVAVTGIAGPDGGSAEKPVGLVHFAVARRDGRVSHAVHSFEDLGRESIRLASVRVALALLMSAASEPSQSP